MSASAVSERWTAASTVRLMTVGDLAGHMFLVVRRVLKRIEAAEPAGAAGGEPAWKWLRVVDAADLSRPEHRAVRDDASHIARWGPDQVAAACLARIETIDELLAVRVPETVSIGTRRLPFTYYLATRIVELLVHTDDLAVSIGQDCQPPPAATGIALRLLLAAARGEHGDQPVLRALSRAERAKGDISVF
jgi:hypothetical protein